MMVPMAADPPVLEEFAQQYVKNLAAMAAGSSASPDPFTPVLDKTVTQGWQAIAAGLQP
jgi:hypothetical protein